MVQSIDEQLDTITQDVADTYTALGVKGATLPAKKGTSNLKATVDSLPKGGFPYQLYSVNADGRALPSFPKTIDENTFAEIVNIASGGLDYFCYAQPYSRGYVCFPNLEVIEQEGMSYFDDKDNKAWEDRYVDENSFPKLQTIGWGSMRHFCVKIKGDLNFPSLTSCLGGDYLFSSVKASTPFVIKMNSLTRLEGFYQAFMSSNIKEFYCDSLESVDCSSIIGTLSEAFKQCSSFEKVSFAKLKKISGNYGCYYTFSGCTSLKEVNMPLLTSASFNNSFSRCSSLVGITFPLLTEMGSNWKYAFERCTSLKTISFPSLTTFKFDSYSNTFSGCKALTEIHFRADMQATVEALSGYASKWGATNATIYFDL